MRALERLPAPHLLALALCLGLAVSLLGLSVGDAFGEQFFLSWDMAFRLLRAGKISLSDDLGDDLIRQLIRRRILPPPRLLRAARLASRRS